MGRPINYKPKIELFKDPGTGIYRCIFAVSIRKSDNLALLLKEDSKDFAIAHLAYEVVDKHFRRYGKDNKPPDTDEDTKEVVLGSFFDPLCNKLYSVEVTIYHYDDSLERVLSDSSSQNTQDAPEEKTSGD